MSGFSASWLELREAADHRARDAGLARALAAHLAGREVQRIVDLGAGTGSNLRALAPRLGPAQEWVLADHDPALLEEAAFRLTRWAEEARAVGDSLVLQREGRQIGVRFLLVDLAGAPEAALRGPCDLVTASALFDLASAVWMGRVARAVAGLKAAFLATLTYDGQDRFTPADPLDAAVIEAFGQHMQRDKGFGPATGPQACDILAGSFRQVGYTLTRAATPWVLRAESAALSRELLAGVADAVAETGAIAPAALAAWRAFRLETAAAPGAEVVIGHEDLLALPA